MNYTFNKYLITNHDNDNNLILYNTLSNKAFCLKDHSAKIFYDIKNEIQQNGMYKGPYSNIKSLLDTGILVKNDEDYNLILKEKEKNALDSHDVFKLIILPTENCNFRCAYCYEEHKPGIMTDVTINNLCELVEKILPDYNILHVSWFGGEPLLALEVIEKTMSKISNICKKHKKSFFCGITTNGYLLTENILRRLLKMHFLYFQITIDGSKKQHDKQRHLIDGRGTYDTILENLMCAKNKIRTSTIKFIIRINLSNDCELGDIISLENLFNDDHRFTLNIQKIFEANNFNGTTFENYFKTIDKFFNDRVSKKIELLTPSETICYAAKNNSLMIRTNGDIGKCTVNLNDPNNYFGNINNISINDFNIRLCSYFNGKSNLKKCNDCPVFPVCFGRQCPARNEQVCEEIKDKYSVLIKSYVPIAKSIVLQEE